MASNGIKCEETASIKANRAADAGQINVEEEEENQENNDSIKTEKNDALVVKTESSTQEMKSSEIEQENGLLQAEIAAIGVIMETKMKQQEPEMMDVAFAVKDVKQMRKKDLKQQKQEEDRSHIRRKAISSNAVLWDSIEWMVTTGAEVDAGQRLGTIGRLEDGTQRPIQSPCKGRLYILSKEQSKELGEDTMEVRNGRTCLMCLANVEDDEENGDMESVNVVSHGQFDSDNIRRQLGAKKLSLVLDLDHTLLHAVRVDDVVGEIVKTDGIHFFFIPGLAQQHVVKLRPGLTEFLTELSVLYDLFIYTHGTRLYAEQIVKIIDPDETYFKNRIVARTDTPDMLHKSLKLLFPSCDDSMILVLDDRIDVWKDNEWNVFLIEPYHYFKCTSEINNASGRGVAGLEDSEAEAREDRHLAQSTTVLKHVHEAFYAGYENGMRDTTAEDQMAGKGRDVKVILSEQKRAILHGCYIVFSGVFPIVGPQSHESHYLWRLSVDLGATPSMTLTDFPLTHLVIHPERLGTQKHVQAKTIDGVLIVTPDWIMKCARTWSHVSEQDFLADEWKAKQISKEPVQNDEADTSTPSEDAPSDIPSATPTVPDSDVNGDQSSAAVAVATESKPVASILVKREIGGAKCGGQVTFAKAIDDSGELPDEDSTAHKSNTVRRSRVVRRSSGASRARNAGASGAVATGVVATGPTKREPTTIIKAKKVKDAKKAPARIVSPSRDVDDAFMRLIEAEERENEEEQKRKQSSSNIKDRLSTRRAEKDNGKRTHASDPVAARPEGKRMRITPPEQIGEAESAEDEEDEELCMVLTKSSCEQLDDLEADILGDL
ncbi:hypothetical protein DD237_000861 [Peronospora effusa]|uniref:RNA polymerase II subunit A C-terminal domain phosphatase n=1 Tax=Peronospora effusa TaxID=542832 RepID=A0A3R7WUP9_9STRA|nr:hypothetical protein DD237_000861 [Peronospora effusa]